MLMNIKNINEVLWDNVSNLMKRAYGKENMYRVVKDSDGSVSLGSLQRIKAKKDVGLDVLVNVARFFDMQPWNLLVHNLDVNNPPVLLISEVEQILYKNMREGVKKMKEMDMQ